MEPLATSPEESEAFARRAGGGKANLGIGGMDLEFPDVTWSTGGAGAAAAE